MSGRFVAATTVTSFNASIPSISVNNWAKTRSPTPADEDPEPLAEPKASNSSRKTIAGATCRARRKTSRTALSDSPTHLLNNSGPCGVRCYHEDIHTKKD